MWKNKTFANSYNKLVTQSLIAQSISSNSEITVNLLQETLKTCATDVFHRLKSDNDFHFIATKTWWNNDLTKKRKTLQIMFNQCDQKASETIDQNISHNRYLLARKDFRILTKRCKNKATSNHYVNVENIKNVNPKS